MNTKTFAQLSSRSFLEGETFVCRIEWQKIFRACIVLQQHFECVLFVNFWMSVSSIFTSAFSRFHSFVWFCVCLCFGAMPKEEKNLHISLIKIRKRSMDYLHKLYGIENDIELSEWQVLWHELLGILWCNGGIIDNIERPKWKRNNAKCITSWK